MEDAVSSLADYVARPRWQIRAACRGLGPGIFFPDRGARIDPAVIAICAECPVRVECSDAGAREEYGIWAGESSGIRQKRSARDLERMRQARAREYERTRKAAYRARLKAPA